MDNDQEPAPTSNRRAAGGSEAFLPIGIVFLAVALALMFGGTTSWMQKPSAQDEPDTTTTPQD
jgi:hypothetical protein